MTQKPNGEQWGSKLGVILAVAGSAVGLGNFLRFPGLAADFGGGAFMIPYFCALVFLGVPICWVEWTMGRRGGRFGFNSAPGIFSVLWKNPLAPYLGAMGLLIPVVIYMYYVYIESWCLLYAFSYATGAFSSFGRNPYAYGEFFSNVTGVTSDGAIFTNGIQPIFWFFLITFAMNFVVIYRGLSGGIETFCKWAMPMLVVAAIIVVVRVLTLPEQPAPEPWQRSLPKVLSADAWQQLQRDLMTNFDVIPAGDDAQANPVSRWAAPRQTQLDAALKSLYDQIRAGTLNIQEPVSPPAGFASRPEGLAVALAELADPQRQAYLDWLARLKSQTSFDQKRRLGQLERRQIRLDNKKTLGADDKAQLQAITDERHVLLHQAAGADPPTLAVPVLESSARSAAIERSAAVEAAELPRTVANGLGYMWNPDFEELANPEVWLAAAGQIFFSLSVGFGVIINYASYLRRKDDVVLSGLTATATNEFCEVCLGGLVAIPATFIFLGAATTMEVISKQSSFGLGFNTLPTVFAGMPLGQFFAVAWFFLLFLAGITSSLSMLQPAIAFLEEGFGMKRHASVAALGLITLGGAMPVVYFSEELKVLDTMDYWVGTFMIYVFATVQVLIFGWVIGIDKGFEEAHLGARMRIPSIFRFIIKYITPTYLLVIFAAWLIQNAPGRIAAIPESSAVQATVIGMIGFFVFLLLLVRLASVEWAKQGRGQQEDIS